jgi:hypothetical protein
MGGLIDRRRRFSVEGRPVVTGMASLADAWACTNPSLGRGMTTGLLHAQRLRDTAREHVDDPLAFARAWNHVTETEFGPRYEDVIGENRRRRDEISSHLYGRRGYAPDAQIGRALSLAAHDPDVFRAYLETRAGLITMREMLARPEVAERLGESAESATTPPMALPGPDRGQLLRLLGGEGLRQPAALRHAAGGRSR